MEVMKMRCSEPPFTPCFSPNNVHTTTPAAVTPLSPSTPPNSVPPPPPLPKASPEGATAVVASPCAACKILRRRCSAEKCLLAPYFPPTDPLKFATAHKVFGASNIMKLLQELPENQRADAVSSMVYEANARLRDPVYGSAGAICQLQKQLSQLQAELAKAQAELLNMKCQQSHLLAMLYMNPTTPANSDPDSSNSDPDGFFNFYPDPPNSSLITSWDLASLIE